MGKHSLREADLPTNAIATDVLDILEDDDIFLPGDLFEPQGDWQLGPQLTFVEMEVLPSPDWRGRQKHPDWKDNLDYSMQARLTLHAEETDVNLIKKVLDEWFSLHAAEDRELGLKYLRHEVKSSTSAYQVVEVIALWDSCEFEDEIRNGSFTFKGSPRFNNMWSEHMNALITEGVCYTHGEVNSVSQSTSASTLRDSLRKNITYLAESTAIDHHPNSSNIVRDLVHPALYPYIEGVSKMKSEVAVEASEVGDAATHDLWGRKYEDSKFQWLPTPFLISDEGKCTIAEYVNNLDREKFSLLYTDLEKLFEIFLPYFEEVWSYVKSVRFFGRKGLQSGFDDVNAAVTTVKEHVSLKARELQVIVKIVEYTLQPGQAYEGVWHAEGMSHENIVMTGLYFIDRDADLVGGDLRFKRSFTIAERNEVFGNIPQCRPHYIDEFAHEGFVPLGYFPTDEGYLLVFPNCHIHKISKLVNSSNTTNASRRVVVFFVVNPDKRIISTREVPPQQNVMTLEEAKNFRLELMAERKFDKEKLNVRDIELCEH